jgi:hypothetical protein
MLLEIFRKMADKVKRGRGRPPGSLNKKTLQNMTKEEKLQTVQPVEAKDTGTVKQLPDPVLAAIPKEKIRLLPTANVFEILVAVEQAEDEDTRIKGLRYWADKNGALRPVLKWQFDNAIVSKLPDGKTPFTRNSAPGPDLTESSLRHEFKMFKYFVESASDVQQTKREHMWIELLEKIPTEEAAIMDQVKDKKLVAFKNLTKNLVQKAFPDLISN